MTNAALTPEDQARANFYALLARLLHEPPDPGLLQALAGMGERGGGTPLERATGELARSAACADPDGIREEYESLFVGTGRAEVTLYAGAYTLSGALDNPLVKIREFLSAQGLERRPSVHEPEDHIAALLEVMRHLVLRGDVAVQKIFFEQFIWPAAEPLCTAIREHSRSAFYRAAADLAWHFAEVEHDAFQID